MLMIPIATPLFFFFCINIISPFSCYPQADTKINLDADVKMYQKKRKIGTEPDPFRVGLFRRLSIKCENFGFTP